MIEGERCFNRSSMTTQKFNNHCTIVHKTHNNPKSMDNNPRNIGVVIFITLEINDHAICPILIKPS